MCSAVNQSSDIEDVYELTSLQEGMLFHTLRDTKLGMFVNVAIFSMYDIDVDAWKYPGKV